jgi:DNA modification methylase
VRGALQTLRREGAARRLGPSVWILDGAPAAPRRAVLVSLGGTHGDVELRLAQAADLLAQLDEPAALVCTDPPYGLGVGRGARHDTGQRTYARDGSAVVGGYVDVDPAAYREFTAEWVSAAAAALAPGGYLAAVTGPQQAAWVQVAAEDAGLTYVNSIAVGRVFALRTTRRFAHAHWTVTVMCSGPLSSGRRTFTTPPDLPKARSGVDYPLDLWPIGDVGRADARPGALRYPNTLPVKLVDRLVGALTRPADARSGRDLVCDPFVGGGTTALVALRRGLRFVGGDVNPAALSFTAARLSVDVADRGARLDGAAVAS